MAEPSFEWEKAALDSKAVAEKAIGQYKAVIDSALIDAFEGDTHLSVASSIAVSSGGKRLRPILALLTCEAVSGSYSSAIPVALSYELAHAASLIQDDIIDESSLRHNMPTVHKKYGSVRAILVSDFLLFTIFSELSKFSKAKTTQNRIAQVLLHVANSAKMAAKGEFSDMLLTTKGDVTEDEYFEMAGLKTGALYAGAAASGAIVGGAKEKIVDAMYEFGYYLGLSFQIVDDILDFVGDPKETGKPLFKDLKNHACNIVTVHALSKATEFDRNATHSLLLRHSLSAINAKKIISILEKLGSLEYAGALGARYSSFCRQHLSCLGDSPARAKLEALSYYIMLPIQHKISRGVESAQ